MTVRPPVTTSVTLRDVVLSLGLVVLLLTPLATWLLDESFYLSLTSKIMILAIAALSLDLILGFGGMVSFGHAVYLGVGAYTVGIFWYYGINSGFIQWPVAILVSAGLAALIGLISLRTTGVYFIMITLAFGQMVFFFAQSLETFGGDDGMTIWERSQFFDWKFDIGIPAFLQGPTAQKAAESTAVIDLTLKNNYFLYYVILAVLLGCLYVSYRLVNSRFGMVIRGGKSNLRRMETIGFPVFRYKLLAFVIAGAMCGLAGVLWANMDEFVSPNYMSWIRHGDLIFMVVLGGMGTLFGPIFGAAVFILLSEEILPQYTEHWPIIFGPFLILVVLFAKKGIYGLLEPPEVDSARTPESAKPAAPLIRVAAFVVDLAIVAAADMAAYYVLVALFAAFAVSGPPPALVHFVLYALIPGAYFIAFPASRWQATPAMRLLAVHVVASDGRRVVPRQAFQRFIAQIFSTLIVGLGHLMMFFDPERRALHDRLCATRVIAGRPSESRG